MPVPPRLHDQIVTRLAAAVLALLTLPAGSGPALSAQPGAAWVVRSLQHPAERQQSRAAVLDAPARRVIRIAIDDRVRSLDLEEYVAGVVAGEGQPAASDAAQQALAITARTYALANVNRHRREGFDLCDTTHCQVVRPATGTTRRAAAATAGRVLVHRGQPASVYYSALCGGHSELASNVWPGADDASSHLHHDEACRDEPGWSSDVRIDQVERAIRAAGHRGDRLRDLRVLQRNASGRVARIAVDGFTPNVMTGHEFRMAVGRVAGWQQIRSTAFQVRRMSSGYRFTGTGYGHGVGLCVVGAGRRAARGTSAEEILRFYFPNLTIATFRGSGTTAAATTPAAASAASRDDVLIALPAEEDSERPRLAQLVRQVRDEIAARAGSKPPPQIRVTIHPTVDAFARATGQPWWVSGATDGTAIDLLPVTLLRQQGLLERTLRHEIAHVMIDAALRGRRLWVREGAAFYFADPAERAEAAVRGGCPSDQELLRPLSAGAHRDAHARAEACFRRAIARGTDWREVR